MRFTFLLLGLLAVHLPSSRLAAEERPNFILIYTDDHGHADLSIHGYEKDLRTPHLDALARSGVLAKHGYSTAPQCVPSRGGLMTGKFQGRFNLDNNGSSLEGFDRETTIATRLQKAGYSTAQFGKWHLGPTTAIPKHGFTHTFSQHSQRPFSSNITLDGKDQPMGDLPPAMYHIDGCSMAAASVIKRYKDQPFFLYIAYRAPHTPLDAPKKYLERFPGEMPERRRAALGMLSAIDDGVGLITDTLKACGLSEKTVVFFIADNGAPLKIHKIDSPLNGDAGGWDGSLNTPLNGEKGMLAEGGMHVPFLVSWPGKIPAGQVYEHPVSSLDFAATAAALAKVETKPGDLDGVNLLPHLTGEKAEAPHESLFWRWTAQSAVREGNWKLLRGGDREYLYDLSVDLGEKHNIAAQHPDVAKRLREKLTSWCAELNPPGLALAPMASTWHEYFDVYLDGKTPPPVAGVAKGKTKRAPDTWEARNASIVTRDGIMEIRPEKADRPTFITRAGLKLGAPLKIEIISQTAKGGKAAIAWRESGDQDFLPERVQPFTMSGGEEWQSQVVEIPAKGKVIHVRVHLPLGVVRLKGLRFLPPR